MNCPLDPRCSHLITGMYGEYFLCTGFQVKRIIPRKKDGKKTYFNIWSGFKYRMAPIKLKKDKDGNPLKCKQCLKLEKKLAEVI